MVVKVELRAHDGLVGVVELRGGLAAPDEGARKFLNRLAVVVPGEPRHRLRFEDGAAYLEALQHNLRGTYLWATAPLE